MKPWYKLVTPREDLREGKPLDASEFAVLLDHVRDGRAPAVYQNPAEFFERTYLTRTLSDLAVQVIRRLNGEKVETSAVFNLATQFGGGKTHALTLLYHLAQGGEKARRWKGVEILLQEAKAKAVPATPTAIFVGTEFDSLAGRGGADGTPLRRTPWGEIAFQLGGAEGFALVAEHEEKRMAPGGDVIERMLPKGKPALLLLDELMNYVSRNRASGLSGQLYSFLQSLSEVVRSRNEVVLAVSIPASELEMSAEDVADHERFKKLLDRLAEIKAELGSDKVFDVVGELLPSNLLDQLFREMYVQRMKVEEIEARIVKDVDPERFRAITGSTLEGLAKKELNLAALVGRSEEARERRLVPEVVEHFFLDAAPLAGVHPSAVRAGAKVYRVGKVPSTLREVGQRLETRFGHLGREYQRVVFDKKPLEEDATLEWVTPGHPLFEAVRTDVLERVTTDLRRGATFWDLHAEAPYRLDVFTSSVRDGRGAALHERLFVARCEAGGALSVRQPTLFLDLVPAASGAAVPPAEGLPDRAAVETFLYERAFRPFLGEVASQRSRENETVTKHVEISLAELIHRQNMALATLVSRQQGGGATPGLSGNIRQASDHLDELNARRERRLAELEKERHCSISDIRYLGRAWVLPHPERAAPALASMVRDDEVEKTAVREAIRHEEARGWVVESVETENRGFDLISRKPHPEDPKTAIEVRFIEVKGRAGVGEVALTSNEYLTAQRLGKDYWLYVAFNCATTPDLHVVRNPGALPWKPVVTVEHYVVKPQAVKDAATADDGGRSC